MFAAFKKIFLKVFSLILTIMTVSGCTVGPDYNPPEVPLTPNWHTQLDKGLSAEQMGQQLQSSWWTTFNDAELSSLIERAVTNNLDMKKALSRVRQAYASRGITQAGLFPNLNFSGSDTWTRSNIDTGSGRTTQRFSTSFDSSWEMDIFGGVHRSLEAADASLQASEENLRNTLVSLLAEVALNYVEVRTYQVRLATVNENLQSQSETYQLTLWRSQAELNDELAMQQARYNLESTRAEIPSIRTGLEEAMNRIAVLLGEQPGKLHQELEKDANIPSCPAQIAVGVPAEMIRRRPDVRQAERELASQTAKIGVATAELYPRFTLSGSIGIDAVSFNRLASNLTTPDNWVLSGGPRASWSIFDAGAIRRNIQVQTELQKQALLTYESTVLGAVEEVENAVVAYINEQSRNNNLKEAAQAAKRAAELSRQKYETGLADFGDVLDSQRSLLSFQNQFSQSNGTLISNLIRLYKALGGGWTSLAAENAEQLTGENNEK
jgi:outer membrane protein, multidrug efflux system